MTRRVMTQALQDYLDSLSAAEQRSIIRLAREADASATFSALLTAVAIEVAAQVARDEALLAWLDQDHQAEVEQRATDLGAVDPPPPAGRSATFDPETREWT